MEHISIHALREEGDLVRLIRLLDKHCISIHALREEGDQKQPYATAPPGYFYPRPPRGGRPFSATIATKPKIISIHALREEGDNFASSGMEPVTYFYPRPPRGGRQNCSRLASKGYSFLSTPSARRATGKDAQLTKAVEISIHALREEGDVQMFPSERAEDISIHALREEGDLDDSAIGKVCKDFYPRPPRGGRPAILSESIRERDNFYPRPPRGGRP